MAQIYADRKSIYPRPSAQSAVIWFLLGLALLRCVGRGWGFIGGARVFGVGRNGRPGRPAPLGGPVGIMGLHGSSGCRFVIGWFSVLSVVQGTDLIADPEVHLQGDIAQPHSHRAKFEFALDDAEIGVGLLDFAIPNVWASSKGQVVLACFIIASRIRPAASASSWAW